MKVIISTLLVGFSLSGFSEVIKADSNSIQDDLSFKIQSQPKIKKRSLASEAEVKTEESKESSRELANQPEDTDSNMEYWEY